MALTEHTVAPAWAPTEPDRYVQVSLLPVGHPWRHAGIDRAHVIEIAAALGQLPPVLVRRSDHLVIDGAHRVAAARRLGLHALPVTWFEGNGLDVAAAFLDANREGRGLAVVPRDREALLRWVVQAEPMWSDRCIAWSCGVSPKTIARVRVVTGGQHAGVERRIGRDGRARPVQPGAVRDRVADALAEDPAASLRTIASRVGVSPETVRSVKRNLSVSSTRGAARVHESRIEAAGFGPLSPEPAPSWQDDRAFRSTDDGASFVDWFEATSPDPASCHRHVEVPLSRVYEIADEARRRARFWQDFAGDVEARSRPAR